MQVAVEQRAVEAELLAHLLDLLRVDARAAAVAPAAANRAAIDAAARAFRVEPAEAAFHRPAGDELGDQEGQRQHAEQGGDHRQQAFAEVEPHEQAFSGRPWKPGNCTDRATR
ncbi:hypothetical protein D9M69_517960 [compost metagenome]